MTLEVFDPYGVIDREATIHLEAISEVRVDSERLQSLKLLSNWHQLPGLYKFHFWTQMNTEKCEDV